jgi:3-phenylpropionate/trans-cinnamate dioxygenase ferredoxin subunit
MTLHTVCQKDDLKVGDKKAVTVAGNRIVLYRLEDGFHATQASCTHMFAPLVRGRIVDGCEIQCPFHRARFDVRTGEVIEWASFPPGIQALNFVRGEKALKTYKVSVKGSDVQVRVD